MSEVKKLIKEVLHENRYNSLGETVWLSPQQVWEKLQGKYSYDHISKILRQLCEEAWAQRSWEPHKRRFTYRAMRESKP